MPANIKVKNEFKLELVRLTLNIDDFIEFVLASSAYHLIQMNYKINKKYAEVNFISTVHNKQ